jgi:hypothetical protein
MEELSVRSNIVLSQKKVVSEMDGDNGTLESEYVALCAQVVSVVAAAGCNVLRNRLG